MCALFNTLYLNIYMSDNIQIVYQISILIDSVRRMQNFRLLIREDYKPYAKKKYISGDTDMIFKIHFSLKTLISGCL